MTLDNPALAGRLRTSAPARRSLYERRAVGAVVPRMAGDVRRTKSAPKITGKPAPPTHKNTLVARPSPKTPGNRTMHSTVLRRDAVAARRPRHQRHISLRGRVLPVTALALCMLGVYVGISGLRTNHKVAAQVTQIVRQASTGTNSPASIPSEVKPAAGQSVSSYSVAPDLPKELQIPALNVDARILRLDALKNGDLATPPNIFDSGWYTGSSKPGQAGAMLIDGHVSGPTQNGVFYGLKTLKPGDKIVVVRGDGQRFSYSVVTSKVYDADAVDMAAALTPVTAGKNGLNLITCTGKLNSTATGFQQRILVFAVQD